MTTVLAWVVGVPVLLWLGFVLLLGMASLVLAIPEPPGAPAARPGVPAESESSPPPEKDWQP